MNLASPSRQFLRNLTLVAIAQLLLLCFGDEPRPWQAVGFSASAQLWLMQLCDILFRVKP